jgi:hypothetical protein
MRLLEVIKGLFALWVIKNESQSPSLLFLNQSPKSFSQAHVSILAQILQFYLIFYQFSLLNVLCFALSTYCPLSSPCNPSIHIYLFNLCSSLIWSLFYFLSHIILQFKNITFKLPPYISINSVSSSTSFSSIVIY